MKTIKRLSILTVLLGLVLLNTTCGKQSLTKHVTWEGHIYNSSGTPASGIVVSLEGGLSTGGAATYQNFEIGQCTTDVNGHFYIHGKAARQDAYFPDVYCSVCPNYIFFAEDPTHTKPVRGDDLSSSKFTKIILP